MKQRILVSFSVLMLLGCGLIVAFAPGIWQSFTDSARVASVARTIADFDLPATYQPDYAIDALGYSIAAYKSGERSHLVLMQAGEGTALNNGVLEGYIANDNGSTTWSNVTELYSAPTTVRDRPATVTASERTNGAGQPYRQLNLVFAGKGGTALLVINQPTSEWDESAIQAFIDSIH